MPISFRSLNNQILYAIWGLITYVNTRFTTIERLVYRSVVKKNVCNVLVNHRLGISKVSVVYRSTIIGITCTFFFTHLIPEAFPFFTTEGTGELTWSGHYCLLHNGCCWHQLDKLVTNLGPFHLNRECAVLMSLMGGLDQVVAECLWQVSDLSVTHQGSNDWLATGRLSRRPTTGHISVKL